MIVFDKPESEAFAKEVLELARANRLAGALMVLNHLGPKVDYDRIANTFVSVYSRDRGFYDNPLLCGATYEEERQLVCKKCKIDSALEARLISLMAN